MNKFSAGRNVSQGTYSCFIPEFINRKWALDDVDVINLLGQAERAIGRLDMFSDYIPNINLFIRMHVVKEATQSTKIEGTKTNIEDVLQTRDEIPSDKRDDWDEVQNYIKALHLAMDQINNLPFSSRLIRTIHRTLLQGVRGQHKNPGEFRRSQNWIGGASINDATFVPPVHTMVPDLMSDLEKFANSNDNSLPDLIKIAIIHYQFETTHPFLDGNGRVGRLLIPIYLVDRKLLKTPSLYISDFFERNRKLYYDNLTLVRSDSNIKQWVKFFLTGIIEIAQRGVETFDSVLKLQNQVEANLAPLKGRLPSAHRVMEQLYQNPYINAAMVAKVTGKTPASAYKLIEDLVKLGVLVEITGGKRDKRYLFKKYLDIFYK